MVLHAQSITRVVVRRRARASNDSTTRSGVDTALAGRGAQWRHWRDWEGRVAVGLHVSSDSREECALDALLGFR